MHRVMLIGFFALMLCGTVEAGVQDWPVIGQVSRVGVCLVKSTGQLVGSLLGHLSAWGVELVGTIGDCAKVVVGNTEEVATGVVTLTVPTPSTTTTEEAVHE